ncbi:hypothetical protein BX600DRAFT_543620 [Xylariales sp. PMI_506]|nr:hypothetical protein BX600DRAFT_543620 [Xylariales sp. PMI_506]
MREIKRFITGHNTNGLAVFKEDISDTVPTQPLPTGDTLYLGYATNQLPTDLTKDLAVYQEYLAGSPVFTVPGGTVMSVIDLAPGSAGPFHRTVSLDYGVVIEGAVELELDSGEARTLYQGDMIVQRGTKHLWRNASKTESARVLFVLQEAEPIEIAGKTLKEEFGVELLPWLQNVQRQRHACEIPVLPYWQKSLGFR